MRRQLGARLRDLLRRDDRGAALALVAVSLVVLLGMTALAIDLGMLFDARNEAQRTADAAALAAASALVTLGNDPSSGVEQEMVDRAQEYTAENPVHDVAASVQPSDVDADLPNWRVTVTVHRTADRGNPVATRLAQVIGFDAVDVTALATAEAVEAGGVNCLLPLAIPDRWEDVDGDGLYDPAVDIYIPWEPGLEPGDYTGYGPDDWGDRIVIKPFKKSGKMNESWYFPWRPPGQSGAADYRENIQSCVDESIVYETGQEVDTEPGAMIGPTKQGFGDLIAQDPGEVSWNASRQCLEWVSPTGSQTDGCIESSPRLRTAPMFDPRDEPDPGAKPFTFRNFARVFVDEIVGNEVYAYLMPGTGVRPPGTGGGACGPNCRIIRLVQ